MSTQPNSLITRGTVAGISAAAGWQANAVVQTYVPRLILQQMIAKHGTLIGGYVSGPMAVRAALPMISLGGGAAGFVAAFAVETVALYTFNRIWDHFAQKRENKQAERMIEEMIRHLPNMPSTGPEMTSSDLLQSVMSPPVQEAIDLYGMPSPMISQLDQA